MGALLKRDFLISYQYYLLFIIFVPIFYIFYIKPFLMFHSLFTVFVSAMFYSDKQSEINRYLVSLPVSRSQIITARYLFLFINLIIIYLYFLIVDIFFYKFYYVKFPPAVDYLAPMDYKTIFTYIFIQSIVMGISIPIYVKFQYNIALVVNFIVIFIAPISLIFLSINISMWEWSEPLIEMLLKNLSLLVLIIEKFLIILLIGSPVIIGLLSYLLSRRIFIRKDVF